MSNWTEFDSQAMDASAKAAKVELKSVKTAQDVYNWFKKWYTSAGHKRLGRILASRGATAPEQKLITAQALKSSILQNSSQSTTMAVAMTKAATRKRKQK